ncbi:hypothetical protein OSB04_029323 [Centaurea solstitialis]|uniref:Retrotransposon gag domain-containing protein n=1 Tax=Centaurea solstitialis TaxID=347529 RepID=A0AA38T0Z2_9ASTR|nr:hypothetical protein OSB04_029323 [Centaurea solstitialis]
MDSVPSKKITEKPRITIKEKIEEEASSEEDEKDESASKSNRNSRQPFKVEARIDIPTFDDTIDAEKLDSWIDQLETYFTLYGFSSKEKVSFARLKLTSHALAWWNSHLKTVDEEEIGWKEFTHLIRHEYYPMGYSQERWSRWHNFRQQRGQSVQEYTTEFQRLAVTLGISTENEDVFTKYVAGLHQQIRNELRLHAVGDVSRHVKEKCWKVHPELFPKKWIKEDKGKRTTATAIPNNIVELGQVGGVDKSLMLMARPRETPPIATSASEEKEELFTLKIQVKQEVIEAIVDTGSQKNLISASLVERLGLVTTPHPRPYSLGWIQKDVDMQINRQCKVRFAITNQYIDDILCEVVPLDIYQVIFGSPYHGSGMLYISVVHKSINSRRMELSIWSTKTRPEKGSNWLLLAKQGGW